MKIKDAIKNFFKNNELQKNIDDSKKEIAEYIAFKFNYILLEELSKEQLKELNSYSVINKKDYEKAIKKHLEQ